MKAHVGAPLKVFGHHKDLSRPHADILKGGCVSKDPYLGNTLVSFYTKCGALTKAKDVFDRLLVRDVVSWNALITGYANNNSNINNNEAFTCFQRMLCEGLPPNAITFCCLLKACGKLQDHDKGKLIHAEIIRVEVIENDIFLGAALVDMYVKCGDIVNARNASDHLPVHSVVSWTALITGYAQCGHGKEALQCYEELQRGGLKPNALTYVSILKACSSLGENVKGEEIHREIIHAGLVGKDIFVNTGLVDMYAKCGAIANALEAFNQCCVRNEVLWNALIAGYADQHKHVEEAIHSFERMHCEGLSPNVITFVSILKACGDTGMIHKGEEVHTKIVCIDGLLEKDVLLGTALVDMYAKCGSLMKAQEVFDMLPVRNVASWSALIMAYSQLGKDEIFVKLFERMIVDGVKPDVITFNIMLNACSHSGLLDKAEMYFESMSACYSIVPTLEHHSCMIGLYGRAGHFDKVLRMIRKMPTLDYLPMWTALLGACQKWENVELGRLAFEHTVRLDVKYVTAYVCMGNIYAAASMQAEADKMEAMRIQIQAWS